SQRCDSNGRPSAGGSLAGAGDEPGDGLLPRRRPRRHGHGLVVRPRTDLAGELQVALEPAVQVGFEDLLRDLHGYALRGWRSPARRGYAGRPVHRAGDVALAHDVVTSAGTTVPAGRMPRPAAGARPDRGRPSDGGRSTSLSCRAANSEEPAAVLV